MYMVLACFAIYAQDESIVSLSLKKMYSQSSPLIFIFLIHVSSVYQNSQLDDIYTVMMAMQDAPKSVGVKIQRIAHPIERY